MEVNFKLRFPPKVPPPELAPKKPQVYQSPKSGKSKSSCSYTGWYMPTYHAYPYLGCSTARAHSIYQHLDELQQHKVKCCLATISTATIKYGMTTERVPWLPILQQIVWTGEMGPERPTSCSNMSIRHVKITRQVVSSKNSLSTAGEVYQLGKPDMEAIRCIKDVPAAVESGSSMPRWQALPRQQAQCISGYTCQKTWAEQMRAGSHIPHWVSLWKTSHVSAFPDLLSTWTTSHMRSLVLKDIFPIGVRVSRSQTWICQGTRINTYSIIRQGCPSQSMQMSNR